MTDPTQMESTPKKMTICPMCRLSMRDAGRLVAFRDDAGQSFSFAICPRCAGRLDRLPMPVQSKQLAAAINQLIKHPERYAVKQHPDEGAARLYVAVEAAHLRGEF